MKLPPMLQAPTPDQLSAMAQAPTVAKRRRTLDRRTEYRQAILRVLAARLEAPRGSAASALAMPRPEAFELSEAQAAGIRRDMAQVLRHRAEANQGRIRT